MKIKWLRDLRSELRPRPGHASQRPRPGANRRDQILVPSAAEEAEESQILETISNPGEISVKRETI